jgi:hypothetical protein
MQTLEVKTEGTHTWQVFPIFRLPTIADGAERTVPAASGSRRVFDSPVRILYVRMLASAGGWGGIDLPGG